MSNNFRRTAVFSVESSGVKLWFTNHICIGNSMICSDIWYKYYERYFEIVIRNFTSR